MKSNFNKFTTYYLLFVINIGCISNNKLEMRNEIHCKEKQCKNKKDFINNTRIIPYFLNKNQTNHIIGKWFKDNVIPIENKNNSINNQSDDNSRFSSSNDINLNSDWCNQILPCDISNLISSFYIPKVSEVTRDIVVYDAFFQAFGKFFIGEEYI